MEKEKNREIDIKDIFTKRIGDKELKGYGKKIINCCEDCGKIINSFYSKKCSSCSKLGRKISDKGRENIKKAKLGKNNPMWKGNNVQYRALHQWLKRNKKPVGSCEKCFKVKRLCLANISGEYKRDVNDYKWLCYSCHNKIDMIGLNFHNKLKSAKAGGKQKWEV